MPVRPFLSVALAICTLVPVVADAQLPPPGGNAPPSIAANAGIVTVTAGSTATNTGTYSDPNVTDVVTIRMTPGSPGSVSKTGTHSGTWSWSFVTPPSGPASYTVRVEAVDGKSGAAVIAFTVNVNPAPVLPPAFSVDLPLPDADACICLPPYMIQAPNARHNWWALATGIGPLDIQVYGISVNPADTGNLEVSVFDAGGNPVFTGTQPQPPGGETAWAPITFFPSAGEKYRISLRIIGVPGQPAARHYRLKLRGASLLGSNNPLPSQAEHEDANWQVNAAAGENFTVAVSPGIEAGATSGAVFLTSPSGVLTSVPLAQFGWQIHIAGAEAGIWTVHPRVNGHYVVRKIGGSDTGIYVNWLTWGETTLSGTISPAGVPVTVELFDSRGNLYESIPNVTGSYQFAHVSPDTYTVRIIAPGIDVPAVTIAITCDRPAVVDFVMPSAPAGGKVTAGLLRSRDGGQGGFNVQADENGVKGELQFKAGGTSFHAHSITWLSVSADRTSAWFTGVGVNGQAFAVYVEDNGEPGRNDVFRLWIDGVLFTGTGALTGGNVQIHR